jgi:CPA2 family monovalent cation:H+ antiporter-2
MPAASVIYRDIAYVFAAAVLGGLVARRLRQPLILGYVLGGILIGPFTPGPTVSDIHVLELTAEAGVILLMYSIGIEFSFRDLAHVKWVALLGGPLGIVLSMLLGLGVGRLVGWSAAQGLAMGAIISVASTMVLSRQLIDRGELHSQHGRVMIGITLVEDVAVVALTVLLPAFTSLTGERLLNVGIAIGKAVMLLAPVALVAAKLVPPLMARVARSKSEELSLLVILSLGFVIAAISQAAGLSLALGAFLAGLTVSGSKHSHQTLIRLLPFRDVFVALFFVTIGALINPKALFSQPVLLLTLLSLIVLGKFAVWLAVTKLFRYSLLTAILVGVGLTQIGEFSYVLVQVARSAGLVGSELYNSTLAASLLSIVLNAFLMRLAGKWAQSRVAEAPA